MSTQLYSKEVIINTIRRDPSDNTQVYVDITDDKGGVSTTVKVPKATVLASKKLPGDIVTLSLLTA